MEKYEGWDEDKTGQIWKKKKRDIKEKKENYNNHKNTKLKIYKQTLYKKHISKKHESESEHSS